MQEFLEIFTYDFTWRAFLASGMVGLMCGVLGCFIVLRNMALIGDALAHAVLPGIVGAFILVGYSTLGFFFGAVIAALITSIGITWIQHSIKTKNDAAIGIMFTAMFSIGVIGISWISKQQGVHLDLKDMLFGNVLGVSNEDLVLTAFVTIYVLLSVIILYRYLFITTFQPTIAQTMGISVKTMHYFLMLLLSFAVVASLQTVGVILVVAMLITPASTALLLSEKLKNVIVISGILGMVSAILGMLISILFNTTPGPAMAVTAVAIYLIVAFLAPQKGLLAKYVQKTKLKAKIEIEDILKAILKQPKIERVTIESLEKSLYLNKAELSSKLKSMANKGLIESKEGIIRLTKTGSEETMKLVRAHRLWETYQVNQMGLTDDQIHEEAERLEHLLSPELLDKVDKELGYPKTDPHGSPIPTKEDQNVIRLMDLHEKEMAMLPKAQWDKSISGQLWDLGFVADTEIQLLKIQPDYYVVMNGGNEIKLPRSLANQIRLFHSSESPI